MRKYELRLTSAEVSIVMDALNLYGQVDIVTEPMEVFEASSRDESKYTLFQVKYLWRDLQSRIKRVPAPTPKEYCDCIDNAVVDNERTFFTFCPLCGAYL